MRTKIGRVMTLLTALTLVGCASPPMSSGVGPAMNSSAAGPMMNSIDSIDRNGSTEHEKSMILVTMTIATHKRLLGEGAVNQSPLPVRYEAFLNDLATRYRLERVADWPLSSLGIRCLVFASRGDLPRDKIIAELAKDPQVETAQSLQLFRALATPYDDPYFRLQHSLQSMQVELSHRWATGDGVNVAVIDTGVDANHPELREQIGGMRNFVDVNGQTFLTDVHGTAVAAVIAAAANNGVGMVGVAPDSRILALKACWQETPGYADAVCTSFTLAKAIDFAIMSKSVDVINLSLGGPQDPLLKRLVQKAVAKGILVVGAVSTERSDHFPIYIDGVIPVSEARADYRSQGDKSSLNAPGYRVLSARPGGKYDFFSGSSLSAAHVSGLAALLREREPSISTRDILALLQATSQKTRGDASTPAMVNACLAVASLNDGRGCVENK